MEDPTILGRIGTLEEEAARILPKVQQAARRPLFVEFSGTPKAGKSTIINSLRLFLARNGFKAYVLSERASTCPIRNKKHLFFNAWTACATLTQMLDAGQPVKPGEPGGPRDDVVIMDRGLFDALTWMQWLENRNEMTSEDRATIENFLTLPHWREMIGLVLVMKVTPDVALGREFADLLTRKPGSIMNPQTVEEFNCALDQTLQRYGAQFSSPLIVDTTGQDPKDTGYEVVRLVLEKLDNS